MRPRRDPKRKPPSEQALREALRKDLPEEAAQAARERPPARSKPRKKRKRPARAGGRTAGRTKPEPRSSAPGPEDGPDAEPGAPTEPSRPEEGADAPTGEPVPPSAPAEPTPDPRVEELEDKVRRLTEALEGMSSDKSEMAGVAEKFKGMEDRMKGLLQLSEVLSVRYNPFLSNEEGDVFDGDRHDPSSLLPQGRGAGARDAPNRPREVLRAAPAPVEDRFRGEVVRLEGDGPEPDEASDEPGRGPEPEDAYTHEDDIDAELEAALAPFAEQESAEDDEAADDLVEGGPAEDDAGGDAGGAAGPEPGDGPGPAVEVAAEAEQELEEPEEPEPEVAAAEPEEAPPAQHPVPAPSTAPAAPRAAVPRPAPERVPHRPAPPALPARPAATAQPGPSPPYHPPGRSRESYLALCWFERLAREGDPSEIHLFVDHYAGLGWIPPEHHGWMAYLAESVAPRDPDATWDDVEVPAHELARLHRRNLRFLDKLFRCGLGADDPLRWDDEAQWWMEDG